MKSKQKPKKKIRNALKKEIHDYDKIDTSEMVDPSDPLTFDSIGLSLPTTPPTQVVSIRLPSELLNDLRVIGTERDVGYQALVKIFLADAVAEFKAKAKKRKAA